MFSNLNSSCSNLSDMRNLQEQVKKAFCYQKFFWPFTVWINCPSDLKDFANYWPSASNFKSFCRSLEQFFLTVDKNNFGNKIPLFSFQFMSILVRKQVAQLLLLLHSTEQAHLESMTSKLLKFHVEQVMRKFKHYTNLQLI